MLGEKNEVDMGLFHGISSLVGEHSWDETSTGRLAQNQNIDFETYGASGQRYVSSSWYAGKTSDVLWDLSSIVNYAFHGMPEASEKIQLYLPSGWSMLTVKGHDFTSVKQTSVFAASVRISFFQSCPRGSWLCGEGEGKDLAAHLAVEDLLQALLLQHVCCRVANLASNPSHHRHQIYDPLPDCRILSVAMRAWVLG